MLFCPKNDKMLMPSRLLSSTNTALQTTAYNEKKTDFYLETHLIHQVIETMFGKFDL